MMNKKLQSIIEAILFVSGEAINIKKLASVIEKNEKETKEIIDKLILKYDNDNSGIQIIKINNSYQMCTRPCFFEHIKKIYDVKEKRSLTPSLLETLAIIAYKQPITRMEIEEIRGVRSDNLISKLVGYNLVEEIGRLDAPGKPVLFGTTENFLRYFGFSSIKDLPKLD